VSEQQLEHAFINTLTKTNSKCLGLGKIPHAISEQGAYLPSNGRVTPERKPFSTSYWGNAKALILVDHLRWLENPFMSLQRNIISLMLLFSSLLCARSCRRQDHTDSTWQSLADTPISVGLERPGFLAIIA
jgi:hypothetical protein